MGVTLVVVPVISLADQHVRTLRDQGFTASRVGDPNDKDALRKILSGEVNFGFMGPETATLQFFLAPNSKSSSVIYRLTSATSLSIGG